MIPALAYNSNLIINAGKLKMRLFLNFGGQ